MHHTQVVVVGAGYAGVAAANRIAREGAAHVTVVNLREEFVERIRLHQHAARTGSAVRPLRSVLRPEVALHVGTATRVAGDGVELADGGGLAADRVVHAVGSGAPRSLPGALSVQHLQGATALRDRLDAAAPGTPVTVVGGGLTGIETAAEIAEGRPHLAVRLVASTLAGGLSDAGRDVLRRALAALGVEVREGERVDHVGEGITVDSTSFTVPDLARASGLAVDDAGRLRVDESLRSVQVPTLVAAGDAAATTARWSCQAALPLGMAAAATVLADLCGQEAPAASVGFTATCVSLGRRRGLVQPSELDDTPRGRVLGGRTAALVKEQICRGTVWLARHPSPLFTRTGDLPLVPAWESA
ncbi:FAD-dependent oxidoreductase [Isoptericola sp. AK164]|uniref:FAD-dependent oxidoreductase n=1 Tax=Isoptericola sp. AK164 TaxID=3024246 RepID=UPI0024188C57|nr:FAD-dependent oxidoreductase [Isoptericola sp. AK164]